MSKPSRAPGDLHAATSVQRVAGGFLVTDGLYSAGLNIPRHDHELASLCVVVSGSYDESFGLRARRAEPGMVLIHPEGEHHSEIHDPVSTRPLTIEVEARRLADLRPALRVFDEAWHRKDENLAVFAARIRCEMRRHDSSLLALESVVLEMLAWVDGRPLPKAGCAPWLLQVRDYLEADPTETPSMAQLSQLAGVHPVHLARAFRRTFGCSVGAYARRLQVGRAMILLEDDSLSLSAIAHVAGFSDQSHMTRLVRAQTGVTPGAWRGRQMA